MEKKHTCPIGCMWGKISSFAPKRQPVNLPSGVELLGHNKRPTQPGKSNDFDYQHERYMKGSLSLHDTNGELSHHHGDPKTNISNMNFFSEEMAEAVRSLKNKQNTVGTDYIPVQFIKFCNDMIIKDVCGPLNYCIELRQFPESWTKGLCSFIYKAGDKLNTNNYIDG